MDGFCTLFSGSTGNSSYLGDENDGILIDAGKNMRTVSESMSQLGLSVRGVRAVFITHCHSDHISALSLLMKKLPCLKVYATLPTLCYLQDCGALSDTSRAVAIDGAGTEVGRFFVVPFPTPHDAEGSCGYIIACENGEKVGVCTDLGHYDDNIIESLAGCKTVLLESNHDERMLLAGSYPYPLKQRILSDFGHLSNKNCASLCAILMQRGSRNFILGHLSQHNNLPQLAYETSLGRLCECGAAEDGDFRLKVAPAAVPVRHYGVGK